MSTTCRRVLALGWLSLRDHRPQREGRGALLRSSDWDGLIRAR